MTFVGLLAVAAFVAVVWGFSAAVIWADKKDQAAYDRWFEGFMRQIRG